MEVLQQSSARGSDLPAVDDEIDDFLHVHTLLAFKPMKSKQPNLEPLSSFLVNVTRGVDRGRFFHEQVSVLNIFAFLPLFCLKRSLVEFLLFSSKVSKDHQYSQMFESSLAKTPYC